MLLQKLSKLLELPSPLDEANKKLSFTYIIVNGEPLYVCGISEEYIEGTHNSIHSEDIDTIELWNPEAGIYKIDNFPMMLRKLVEKSYKLSLNSSTYKLYTLKGEGLSQEYYPLLHNKEKQEIFEWDNSIYYLQKSIGKIKGNVLLVTDMNYYQEIVDWNKDKTWQIVP